MAPTPEPDPPVVEETKGEPAEARESSRFNDSFRSDDDFVDQSVDAKRTTADQTAAIDPMNMDTIAEDPEEDRTSVVLPPKQPEPQKQPPPVVTPQPAPVQAPKPKP